MFSYVIKMAHTQWIKSWSEKKVVTKLCMTTKHVLLFEHLAFAHFYNVKEEYKVLTASDKPVKS